MLLSDDELMPPDFSALNEKKTPRSERKPMFYHEGKPVYGVMFLVKGVKYVYDPSYDVFSEEKSEQDG